MYSASITAHDDHGFWVVRSEGTAGTAYVCTRSAEKGFALAAYFATFGELPRADWEAPMSRDDAQGMEMPFSFSYRSEAEAVAQFRDRERISTAVIRGQFLPHAPYADEEDVHPTEDDYNALFSGACIPIGDSRYLLADCGGYVHVIRAGLEYVDADGSTYTRTA